MNIFFYSLALKCNRITDGSVSILPMEDGGPVILYDAPDKIPKPRPSNMCGECTLSVARLNNTKDKYLQTFTRDTGGNPVQIDLKGAKPIDFPSTIWKNGDHYNFVAQGSRFTTKNKSFHSWTRADDPPFVGCRENGGQWWIATPNQVGGAPPPPGTPNQLVNCGGGTSFHIGDYFPANESFVWDGKRTAELEHGQAGWWGSQGGAANNGRMMMVGWIKDYHGPAGPGISFLTRLTAIREVNWDVRTDSLVSNPVPELLNLRTGSLASEHVPALPVGAPHVVGKTGGGAAASSDIVIKFSGFGNETTTFGACVLGDGTAGSGIGITISVSPSANGTHVANVASGACQIATSGHPAGDVHLFDDAELTVRVLADRSVADWFVAGGQWAASDGWQATGPRKAADSNVMLWSGSGGVSAQVDVYGMGCGWLNPSYTENPTM
jgi:hypothetical protein